MNQAVQARLFLVNNHVFVLHSSWVIKSGAPLVSACLSSLSHPFIWVSFVLPFLYELSLICLQSANRFLFALAKQPARLHLIKRYSGKGDLFQLGLYQR